MMMIKLIYDSNRLIIRGKSLSDKAQWRKLVPELVVRPDLLSG